MSCADQNATLISLLLPVRADQPASVRCLHHGNVTQGVQMPRGDKSKYTNKEKRQAEHIEEGYEKRGLPEKEAERRAWATVNKVHGGGEKPGGGGYGKPENHEPMRKGGRKSHGR
jgi:hypothetical protein